MAPTCGASRLVYAVRVNKVLVIKLDDLGSQVCGALLKSLGLTFAFAHSFGCRFGVSGPAGL